jgi:CSLREA domain-containing protein
MRSPAAGLRARFLLAAAFSACVGPAVATTYTVTSEADVPESSPGNGTCDPDFALPGVCTLRAAVQEANAHAGTDSIVLEAGQVLTLTRSGLDDNASGGDLDITDSVTIWFFASGERPVVDAGGQERAFDIRSGNVTLLGFDITGGAALVPGDQYGGAIAVEFDAGIVQLSLLRLHGNQANFGAGLYNDGPSTTLDGSELHGNQSAHDYTDSGGSAIYNRGGLVVRHSSVFDNEGTDGFGATAVRNVPPTTGVPTLEISNSTIASNLGPAVSSVDEAILLVRNSTIGDNVIGVQVLGPGGTFQMRNSVIAHHSGQDCTISGAASLNLDRYNMDSDDTCELGAGSSNYPGTDPRLTPLARHGGFTHASWPLHDSPLLDLGHPVIGGIGCEADDQHFLERPVDYDGDGNERCDIGAIELDSDVLFHDPFDRL